MGLLCVLPFLSNTLQAEVIDSSRVGFVIEQTVELKGVSPADAFSLFTEKVGKWWSPIHTYSGNATNMQFLLEPGGGLLEKWEGGNWVTHLNVVNVQPGNFLVLRGGLGPLQFMAVEGSMSIVFTQSEEVTKVVLTYSVGGFHPKGVSHIAGAVDSVLGIQMDRYKKLVDSW